MESAINQHNYEEFFLLYVDGELSATDKQAVEQFVQENPGFAYELEMLKQASLTGEHLVFDNKNSLYRNESAEINLHNYEEQFLLYVDNELNSGTKEKTETFVLQHPALQEVFTLLKQTRLEPETILFPDKKSLYREEKKEKPVFYLRWQRIAVAAALIGFVVLLWTVLPDITSKQNIAQLQKTVIPINQNNNNVKLQTADKPATVVIEQRSADIAAVSVTARPFTTNVKNSTTEISAVESNDPTVHNAAPTQTVETIKGNTVTGSAAETSLAHTQTLPVENTSLSGVDMVKANNNPEESSKRYFTDNAQQAVYKELDTDDDKKSLLLGSLEINKNKLRGFFRKAGSIFRGKAKAEDEKTEAPASSNTRSLK